MRALQSLTMAVLTVGLLTTAAVGATPEAEASSGPGATIDSRIDIGRRALQLTCRGSGTPTVLLEAGLLMGASSWGSVLQGGDELGRVCAYDRANVGASDAAELPRTISDAVADLRALLTAAQLAPPYILVGHSFGGLVVRLYGATHPEEVAGVVLVDATPPELLGVDSACSELSDAACAAVRSMVGQNPEGIVPSEEELATIEEWIPEVPTRIVVATDHPFPPDIDAELEVLASRLQEALHAAWPTADLVVAEESGHLIQLDRPDIVLEAIADVLEG